MVTPGTTAPVASVTVPRISPELVFCARPKPAMHIMSSATGSTRATAGQKRIGHEPGAPVSKPWAPAKRPSTCMMKPPADFWLGVTPVDSDWKPERCQTLFGLRPKTLVNQPARRRPPYQYLD